jgi:rhodanese-related sulfurtransferase
MGFLKNLFGSKEQVNLKEWVKNGAQIIDVRTPGEFNSGHIKGSKNIPLQMISSQMGKIDKAKPVITCCASGMRSGQAKSMLKAKGYKVTNGGGWRNLQSKLN